MSKFAIALLIIVAAFSFAAAQNPQNQNDHPSRGVAPKVENGIGRADVRVSDKNGNPVRNAFVKLESSRSDGFFCESWGETDENGIIVLLPIHMGSLKLKVKAKGYHKEVIAVERGSLGDPVQVTLRTK
jgi:hypothetical protein